MSDDSDLDWASVREYTLSLLEASACAVAANDVRTLGVPRVGPQIFGDERGRFSRRADGH